MFVVFAVAGADPYIGLATSLTGLFTLGIVAAQALVSIAVVAYYLRRGARPGWSSLVAPALGAAGALTACVAIVANYPVLTGSDSVGARLLPLVLLVALGAGYVVNAASGRTASPSSR
ncbi:hypothetical protein LO762_29755 [Actinocorallia sp. API 0066]|uniref:hypothetical protein n=1 Tax=Actinocorallia sp. API 0066 TaxID=2896846 RepID=UPI001E43CCE7|nr:hypothetical protein [Actinocorallia sp. API 0066]MCD0453335.1 hypothetical protein [Actinocorallia sp. API 0066]